MSKRIKKAPYIRTGERPNYPHPYIAEMADDLRAGKVTRRDFLRTSTLLGLSATAAYTLAGKITGQPFMPTAQAQSGRGGILRCALRIQEMTDPATFDWVPKSNVSRQFVEYLVETGTDNITRPYLAEGWEASEDLKTWTFRLRQGVKWSNGDDFTADDVVFNIERWLNPATGSSNLGLFASMADMGDDGKPKSMSAGAVEKVDAHTVRLHLNSGVLNIPENFYNYPTAIVHRGFEGDISKKPVGTGPYELVEFAVGEKAVLRKRAGYWRGDVSLDEIHYLDLGDEYSAHAAALASGQVDLAYEFYPEHLPLLQSLPNVQLFEAVTAQTAVVRMRVTEKPFDNLKFRQAVGASIDHARVLELAYGGKGTVAENHHVSPIHPEYFKLPARKQDLELAKKLLKESGVADPTIKIDTNKDASWEVNMVQAMGQMWQAAGFKVQINPMPGSQFWEIWDKTAMGCTSWTHRPLGVMVLNLAYRSGVPWNESAYSSKVFDAALDDASSTLDVAERTKKMEKVEKILQDDAVISQPLWRAAFTAGTDKVHNFKMHPTIYHQLNDVWVG